MTEDAPTPKSTARKSSGSSASKPAAAKPAATKKPVAAPPPAPQTTPAPVAPTPVGPQPMLESDARMWAMLTHILALVALFVSGGVLGFAVPLITWLAFRERSVLVDYHAKQNLNLQISLAIVSLSGIVVGFLIFFGAGFILTGPLMLGYFIYTVVISIIAGMRANSGEYYKIPAIFQIIK